MSSIGQIDTRNEIQIDFEKKKHFQVMLTWCVGLLLASLFVGLLNTVFFLFCCSSKRLTTNHHIGDFLLNYELFRFHVRCIATKMASYRSECHSWIFECLADYYFRPKKYIFELLSNLRKCAHFCGFSSLSEKIYDSKDSNGSNIANIQTTFELDVIDEAIW